MRNRFRNPSLKEPLTRSRRNYRWDIEMECNGVYTFVCACVRAQDDTNTPWDEGTVNWNETVRTKYSMGRVLWWSSPCYEALSQISFKADFMQIESPPPINDYDFSGIGLVIGLDRKWMWNVRIIFFIPSSDGRIIFCCSVIRKRRKGRIFFSLIFTIK